MSLLLLRSCLRNHAQASYRQFSTQSASNLLLHEVTPRDGLQNEKKRLTVEQKEALIEKLITLGPKSIEIASFVRGDLVPNMAGASDLCKRLGSNEKFIEFKKNGGSSAALVPNMKGFEELLKNKNVLDTAVVLVSCTDSHSKANVNRTMKEAMKATLSIIDVAKQEGLKVRAYASLAFGCPFEGKVPPERVVDLIGEYDQHKADRLMLADTLGVGLPNQVEDLLFRLKLQLNINSDKVGLHLHDSHSKAHENVMTAWKLGVRDFDAAVGGCGGCNFAPGSKGNVSIEKLLWAIEKVGPKQKLDKSRLRSINNDLSSMLERRLEGEEYS